MRDDLNEMVESLLLEVRLLNELLEDYIYETEEDESARISQAFYSNGEASSQEEFSQSDERRYSNVRRGG